MMPNIGPMEILVVLIIALVVFGPKRLPELGSSLGKSVRGFGKAVKGEEEEEEVPAALSAATAEPAPARHDSRSERA